MKKVLRSLIMASLCIIGVASANAQNRCVVSDGKNFFSEVQVSDNQTVKKVGDNQIITISNPKRNLVYTEGKAVYTLTIEPEEEWTIIAINNDNGFEDFVTYADEGPIYQREVSEGFYDIVVYYEEGLFCTILVYDQFEVYDDTYFAPSKSEATNMIYPVLVDENGNPLEEMNVANDIVHVYLDFVMSHGSFHWSYTWVVEPFLLNYGLFYSNFNNYGSRSTCYITVVVPTTEQKLYAIQLPTINEGMTGNLTLTNSPEDLMVHEEYYNIDNYEVAYFGCDFQSFGPNLKGFLFHSLCNSEAIYNPSEPLKVITNVTNNFEPIVEDGSNMKFRLAPVIYESFDIYNNNNIYVLGFSDALHTCGISLTSEGKMIREPYDFYLNYGLYNGFTLPAYYPNLFPYTPAMYVYEPTKTLIFGSRTPLLSYLPVNYNNETSPLGSAIFGGVISYLGENSILRRKDEDRTLKITYNGQTYFEDSLYLANRTFVNYADAATVFYDITNDNVVVNGVAKTNITHIEFDMNRDDALPPTLNLLQVMDANNEEVITIEDLEHSRINFAGGDYHIDLYRYRNMVYDSEAIVEAFYKTEGSEYQPLEFEEKPEMFHVNYGNYYEIPLSQLVGQVLNQWVTVKFVLSDMAGNSQTQELFNLFYVDDQTSINENQGLQHTVYPNPFNGEVRITAAQAVNGVANIMVYNVLGDRVYNKAENYTETQDFTIDGSAWKPGVYFYSISTVDGVLQGKIVKE